MMKARKQVLIFIAGTIAVLSIYRCNEIDITPRKYSRVSIQDTVIQTNEGITFTGEIISKGDLEILERGFVWSEFNNPLITSPRVYSKEPDAIGKYEQTTNYDFQKGIIYKVRAYLRDTIYTVYSKTIEFESQFDAPVPIIKNFSPDRAKWGDTIKIQGENFSYLTSKIRVFFGERSAPVCYSSDTTIIVLVPENLSNDPVDLKVNIYANSTVFNRKFIYIKPQLFDFFPKNGTFKDTITISGLDFPIYRGSAVVQILMNGITVGPVGFSGSELKLLVPLTLASPESVISVTVAGVTKVFTDKFSLDKPVIIDFSPDKVNMTNDIITITGSNFNPFIQYDSVKIGNNYSQLISASDNELKVRIPGNITEGNHIIEVRTGGMSCTIGKTVSFMSPWTRKADFAGTARWRATGFAINEKGYIGTGNSSADQSASINKKDFWEYDPVADSWVQKADFGGTARQNAFGFSINNSGYIGSGGYTDYVKHLDFWEYNPVSNGWIRKGDYPGWPTGYAPTGYSGVNNGYVFLSKDLWEYNPSGDTWNKEGILPTGNNYRWEAAGFTINGKIYVCTGWDGYTQTLRKELWEYHPGNNTWTPKASFPGTGRKGAIGFTLNGKGYVGLGKLSNGTIASDFWEYNPLTDSWKRVPDLTGFAASNAVSFVINNKAYLGTGLNKSNQVTKDVWEFDPAKE